MQRTYRPKDSVASMVTPVSSDLSKPLVQQPTASVLHAPLDYIFNEEYYRKDYLKRPLSELLTHSRSGNATMVDGYGPELVTNGTFDSDLTGWTTASGYVAFTQSSGQVTGTSNGTFAPQLNQAISTTVGSIYQVKYELVSSTSSGARFRLGTTDVGNEVFEEIVGTTTGSRTKYIVATSATTYISIGYGPSTNGLTQTFDNVSVREMPVLKWAPHNLLTYSEEFDNAAWTQTGTVSITANATTAPDGTETADRLVTTGASALTQGVIQQLGHTIKVWVKAVTVGTNNTFRIQGTGGQLSADFTATGEWQLFSFTPTTLGTNSNWGLNRDSSNNAMDLYVWGAHLYRSDLGGMVDNPDQPASLASYVPTTSAAVQLPRRGHHVYNGSAWVNEGLLHESEARTNLETYSDILDAQWTRIGTTIIEDSAISPSGINDASAVVEQASTSAHHVQGNATIVIGNVYTVSVYAKKNGRSVISFGGLGLYSANENPEFDLENGIAYNGGTGNATVNIQDVGNGWYRCSTTFTAAGAANLLIQLRDQVYNSTPSSAGGETYTGDGTSGVYLWGAQVEEASTPSSYIPTAGASVTRAAETLTIPSAKLPWPTPQIIGDELGSVLTTTVTFDAGDGIRSITNVYGSGSVVSGKVYVIEYTLNCTTAPVTGNELEYRIGTGTPVVMQTISSTGTVSGTTYFTATSSDTFVVRLDEVSSSRGGSYDNINVSVREINPLSVSIQMDGRVTYADTGIINEAVFARWAADSNNGVVLGIDTDSTDTGQFKVFQSESGTSDRVETASNYYAPGVLVPFDIASRHGSTFVNGATEGVALTEDTTPTALPNLSSTNLNLGFIYMGTIARFRVWDVDLGDTGIEAATAPSLEPSLSLTFDSTEGSFTVDDWRA